MCDKKNYVLFTDSECLVLSLNFKLPDENQILLKIPRQDNMYSFDMKNIVPKDGLTCLVAKATSEESMLWHRRLGHVNFKNINKLVKENLVRDLPLKRFENDQTCVACLKGKQHRASSERKNRTLIEAARTMLADSKLPTIFWAEAVSIACYVQNRVLMVKPHNKTPYELFREVKPAIGFMKPFGCHSLFSSTIKIQLVQVWMEKIKQIRLYCHANLEEMLILDDDYLSLSISVVDAQIQYQNGLHDEIDVSEKTHDDSSLQNNGTADQQVNITRPEVNTGSREVSTAVPEVNTATPKDLVGPISSKYKKGIFISQDKYVHEILRKFNYSDVKSASTPTDLEKPLVQDGDAADVDEHLYRSMIGSLMYLTASRPDIMFALLTLIVTMLSNIDNEVQTTGGCQFLGNRLISWQCKKQTVVATSTTEAEYVAAAGCCGQVLWIQNQLLDYGYNFMDTVIYIDNTSTICIDENPVQHSKTKSREIHHFIRDCNAKKLIQMAKIDTQHNVADLLTKGFDAGRFQYLVSSIGMLNP
ncbi:putative ribonuclease H-like domain-containing protein [Tanacetum coccineum]